MPKFNYGDRVKDVITGVEGIVTAYWSCYGRSADAYLIDYKTNSGELSREWIIAERLELVKGV